LDKAVVTDGRLRVAVTIIRSLGSMGVSTASAEAADVLNLGFYSKFASEKIELPKGSHTALSLADVSVLVDAAAGGVVVPVFTPFVSLLSKHRAQYSNRAKFLVPPYDSLMQAHDKEACYRIATDLGIPAPSTRFPREEGVDPQDPGALQEWARDLAYPVIVKYRSGEDMGLSAAERFAICRDPVEVARVYPGMDRKQPNPLIQDYVEGEDWGAALLYDAESRPAASFTYRSLRQKPMEAGPTVYAESAAAPELIEYSRMLLSRLKWQWMAMLDFRRDREGKFHLLEVNPRFWGSMALANLAGVDFARAYYNACIGSQMPVAEQRDGMRIRFFPQDFASIPAYARESRSRLGYVASAALELMNPFLRDGLFQVRDPLPGLMYLVGGLHKRHARN
jgi:predicted ATP-grasp superfamily ATP-dependent carboligase